MDGNEVITTKGQERVHKNLAKENLCEEKKPWKTTVQQHREKDLNKRREWREGRKEFRRGNMRHVKKNESARPARCMDDGTVVREKDGDGSEQT